MLQKDNCKISSEFINSICETFEENNRIDPDVYSNFSVKRGLRNADGTGVVAGVTLIGNVHGYLINEGDVMPIPGELIYRGIDIKDIVSASIDENRFAFEEVAYLLLIGKLPTREQLASFKQLLEDARELPERFTEDVLINQPSFNIMNKLQQSILSLYPYDPNPDDCSLPNIMRQSLELIARFPTIITRAYQVKKYYYDKVSMNLHYQKPGLSTAESFLYAMRPDHQYTPLEARILDLALVLHAEHGGGNNSAFTCRVLSSSGTDTYSAISAAIGSLKGPKHGGANIKVDTMFATIKENVKDWEDDEEIEAFLGKLIRKEAGDGSGLIYGMGHAIYTISDPRAVMLRDHAAALAKQKGMEAEFKLLNKIEQLTPAAFKKYKGSNKQMCANVDLYSGLIYKMLEIPEELYTPLFAMARIAGWSAHRIEEVMTGGRIIRPAYKAVAKPGKYIPIDER